MDKKTYRLHWEVSKWCDIEATSEEEAIKKFWGGEELKNVEEDEITCPPEAEELEKWEERKHEPLKCTHEGCNELQTADGEFCEKHYD
jgi:hypothetical protein